MSLMAAQTSPSSLSHNAISGDSIMLDTHWCGSFGYCIITLQPLATRTTVKPVCSFVCLQNTSAYFYFLIYCNLLCLFKEIFQQAYLAHCVALLLPAMVELLSLSHVIAFSLSDQALKTVTGYLILFCKHPQGFWHMPLDLLSKIIDELKIIFTSCQSIVQYFKV